MADPKTSLPGNFGDVQPWRSQRGTSTYPLTRPCAEYRGAAYLNGPLSPGGYGHPSTSCLICGHGPDEHRATEEAR